MLAHMHAVVIAKKGVISSGGLNTSIARALGLEAKLTTLEPLEPRSLDICACMNMRFVRTRPDRRFPLMVHNIDILSVILPIPNYTEVCIRENWLYDLHATPAASPIHMDILENVNPGGDTDDKYDQKERGSH